MHCSTAHAPTPPRARSSSRFRRFSELIRKRLCSRPSTSSLEKDLTDAQVASSHGCARDRGFSGDGFCDRRHQDEDDNAAGRLLHQGQADDQEGHDRQLEVEDGRRPHGHRDQRQVRLARDDARQLQAQVQEEGQVHRLLPRAPDVDAPEDRRQVTRRLLPLLACILLGAGATDAHAAYSGRCLGGGAGPQCHFWTGKATAVDDGDTITVDIDGDHTSRPFVVRLSTVQAMEQSVYSKHASRRRGECHALEATARLEQLIKRSHWRVRLAAQDPNSHADKRLSRSVAVKIGGRWQDAGQVLMREGLTLWMPGSVEDAWNPTYDRLTQEAHLKGIGMWNPTHCGAGPHQDVPLRAWVNWDPVGIDDQEVGSEWV